MNPEDELINPLFQPIGENDDDDKGGDPPAGDPPAGDPPAADPPKTDPPADPPVGEPPVTAPTPYQILRAAQTIESQLKEQYGEQLTDVEIAGIVKNLEGYGEHLLPGFLANNAHTEFADSLLGKKFREGKIAAPAPQRRAAEPAMTGATAPRTTGGGGDGKSAMRSQFERAFGDALGDKTDAYAKHL